MSQIKSWRLKLIALLLAPTIVLTGCETMSTQYGGNGSAADPRLTQGQTAEFFSRSGWQACLGGGAAAGAVCMLSKGDVGTCLAVAAVGCGALMGTNYYLDVQRSKAANQEQVMGLILKDISKDTNKLRQLNATARQVLADDKSKLARLSQQIKAGKVTKAQAQKELGTAEANIANLQQRLANAKKARDNYEEAMGKTPASKRDTAQARRSIQTYNKEISAMELAIANGVKSARSFKSVIAS